MTLQGKRKEGAKGKAEGKRTSLRVFILSGKETGEDCFSEDS